MTNLHLELDYLDFLKSQGYLRCQQHPYLPLSVWNYTEMTVFKKHWTPETLACRGLVLDADSNIVARPFGKFFNLGEVKKLPREPMVVTDKMDGSLGIIFEYAGVQHVCTRGSFTSEQSVEAASMLTDVHYEHMPGTTILCEIVYPGNRIVVNYEGARFLSYLTTIDNATGRDIPGQVWHGERVREAPYYTKHLHDYQKPHADQKHYTKHANNPRAFLNSLAAQNKPNEEGYVVRFESGLRVKVKFEDYVRLHRVVSGLTPTRIWDSLRNGDDIETMIDGVPDETYIEVMTIVEGLRAEYKSALLMAENVWLHRPDTVDRGILARYFIDSGANESILFKMLDGKDPSEVIWKSIKPPLVSD